MTLYLRINHKQRQQTYLRTCAPSKDSDQPAHLRSLIRIFAGRIVDSQWCKVSSCGQRRHWLYCADVQADLNVRCTCQKVHFLTLRAQMTHNAQIGPYDIRKHRKLRSACASAQIDRTPHCPLTYLTEISEQNIIYTHKGSTTHDYIV